MKDGDELQRQKDVAHYGASLWPDRRPQLYLSFGILFLAL